MKVPELTENTIVIGRNRKKSSQFLLFVILGLVVLRLLLTLTCIYV
jgi:predicted nucleic acid-binding Zn ribbon protein